MRNLFLVLAFIATPAFASGYSAADAAYVTDSKDPNVLNYVVCLAKNSDNDPSKLKLAFVICRGFAAKIKTDGWSAEDIQSAVMECGFRPDNDPNDDMGCE